MDIRRTGQLLKSYCVLAVLAAGLMTAVGDEPSPPPSPRAALQRLNGLIGAWRGVGQPRRQSNRDAWNETADWVWDLQGASPAVVQTVSGGRLCQSLRYEFDSATGEYTALSTAPDGTSRTYRGGWANEQLVLVSPGKSGERSLRLTITPRSDIRLVVLHEATEPDKTVYFRVAEIGYTRAGQRLAAEGGGQPQCVVTGGLGEIAVQHAGQTYYVCCTGCKQAFEADPEKILREYRERVALERKGANQE